MNFIDSNTAPSIHKDPFVKDAVKGIHIHMMESAFGDGVSFSAKVVFKNGNTEGVQNFEGTDFEDLFTQINEFGKSLKG